MPSVLTAAFAGLLIAASAAGRAPLAVALLVVQLALVAGWFAAAAFTTRGQRAGALVAVAGAVAADITLVRVGDASQVRALAGILPAVVGLAFVVQLARRDGRARSTAALAATVGTGALVIAGSVLLGVRGGRGGVDVVVIALAAVGVGLLPVQAKVPWWASMPAGLVVGAGVGVLIAHGRSPVGAGAGGVIAAVAVAVALAARAAVTAVAPGRDRTEPAAETGGEGGAGRRFAVRARLRGALPVVSVASAVPVVVAAPAVLVVARIMVG